MTRHVPGSTASILSGMQTGRRRYDFALLAILRRHHARHDDAQPDVCAVLEELHFRAVAETTVIYATYAAGVLTALLVFGSWSDAIRAPSRAARRNAVRTGQRGGLPQCRFGGATLGGPGAVRSVGRPVHRHRRLR